MPSSPLTCVIFSRQALTTGECCCLYPTILKIRLWYDERPAAVDAALPDFIEIQNAQCPLG
ncbi:hypothetical protein XBJ2_2070010 [Xenorhabdus bovienii str. Jollieti]|uniref:Uncharacterized protein n=1 Tax=Xenorhabdus bovienii (strain SS-2004) TaxID=406818 RepID=D3V6C4_XENBS|nr:hypothetical protein XBJ1_4091 [Xenorhabdus bovienii SS-2004]CDH28918.1 hypothetical protein XBJ2_2070010 [Xenorhabdus bovienii str. Jollieti]